MGALPGMWLAGDRERDEVLRQMALNVAPDLIAARKAEDERPLAHEAVAAMEAG